MQFNQSEFFNGCWTDSKDQFRAYRPSVQERLRERVFNYSRFIHRIPIDGSIWSLDMKIGRFVVKNLELKKLKSSVSKGSTEKLMRTQYLLWRFLQIQDRIGSQIHFDACRQVSIVFFWPRSTLHSLISAAPM
jgi:hypothetical protein